MIPISEKSSGGPLVDWVPEGHDRKYTEPAAMSIRIAATPLAWFAFDARGIDRFFPIKRRAVIGAPRRRPCGGARWKLSHFKPDTCVILPSSRRALYELTRLPDEVLEARITDLPVAEDTAAVAGSGPRVGDFKYRACAVFVGLGPRGGHIDLVDPPINQHYRTLQTVVIVGRIALPLGRGRKAVGARGTIAE